MLVTTKEMFKKSMEEGFAIGAFNVNNMEIIQGIVDAAAESKSPVILQASSSAIKYARIGYLMKMDEDLIVPDKNKTLYDGIKAFGSSTMKKGDTMAKMYFESIGKHYGINIKNKKIKDLPRWFMEKILYGTGDEEIEFEYTSYAGTRNFTAPFEGVLPTLDRRHNETKSQGMRDFYEMYMTNSHCPACNGARLKSEILSIKVGDKNINELTEMSIRKIKEYLNGLKLNKTQAMIAELILKEIDQRLQFLIDVGLEYLTLSRNAGSLSGGESQRIRLATQIGSGLTGVLYILDEPSIGLHQRDNEKLLATLKKLRDLGNTLLVVEHDEDTMKAADYIVDIGPGAGEHGGEVIACGTAKEIMKCKKSITGQYLSGAKKIEVNEDIWQKVWSEEEKLNYGSTPMFMVEVTK